MNINGNNLFMETENKIWKFKDDNVWMVENANHFYWTAFKLYSYWRFKFFLTLANNKT